nr:MAG TPA: Cytochrome C' [Caudoviricetes sp.]
MALPLLTLWVCIACHKITRHRRTGEADASRVARLGHWSTG